MVRDKATIRRAYLETWFLLDFISIIPGYVDCYMVQVDGTKADGLKGVRATKMAKIGRVMRLFRLLKMARILRVSRIVQRWITIINVQYSQLAMIQNLAFIGMTAHWMACAWLIVPQLEELSSVTWISAWLQNRGSGAECYQNMQKQFSSVFQPSPDDRGYQENPEIQKIH